EIEQGPGRVLARAAAAEVRTGDQDLRAIRSRAIRGLPAGEQMPTQSLPGRPLQISRRNDLIGIDILPGQDGDARFHAAERLQAHLVSSLGSAMAPRTAEAAAVAGLARKVRPPGPWRPSKLRLEVLTDDWPGCK